MADGILGIGVCTLDIITVVHSFPGSENVEEAERAIVMGGGPVPTALAAAASLGSRTTLLDRFGDDWRSQRIREELAALCVDLSRAPIQTDSEASLASVFVRKDDGARAVRFVRSTADALRPEDLDEDLLRSHRFIHCNGRHPQACLRAAEICNALENGPQLAFDGGAGRFRPELLPLLAEVALPIVALEFATAATGETSPDHAAIKLAELCPKAEPIGITDGSNGSWIFPHGEDAFHQPAFPVERVIDTTGCGDVYHGAFLHALDTGADYREAARMASAAGALNAMALGGRGALPTQESIARILEKA